MHKERKVCRRFLFSLVRFLTEGFCDIFQSSPYVMVHEEALLDLVIVKHAAKRSVAGLHGHSNFLWETSLHFSRS